MLWLSVAGALFLVWLVLVFLFTPAIDYHLSRRTSVHDDDFLYTIQSTCQAALHQGNQVTVLTNGAEFYPAMLDAIRCASTLDQHGVLYLPAGTRSRTRSSRPCRSARVPASTSRWSSTRSAASISGDVRSSACVMPAAASRPISGCAGTRWRDSTIAPTANC